MAIINCPECDEQVSTEAANCPHCGYPIEEYLLSDEFDDEILPEEITHPLKWEYKRHRRQAITRIVVFSITYILMLFTGMITKETFVWDLLGLCIPAGVVALIFGALLRKGIKDFFIKTGKFFVWLASVAVTAILNLVLLICCGLAGIIIILIAFVLFGGIIATIGQWIPDWLWIGGSLIPFILCIIFTVMDFVYMKNHRDDILDDEIDAY